MLTRLWRLFCRHNILPNRRCLYHHHDKVWGYIDIHNAKAEIVALRIEENIAKFVEPTNPGSTPWILISYELHCDKAIWHICSKAIVTCDGLNYWPVERGMSTKISTFYLQYRDWHWDIPSRQLVRKLASNLSGA